MSKLLEIRCKTCGRDLNEDGAWLDCRAHFTRDLEAARADLAEARAEVGRLRGALGATGRGLEGVYRIINQAHVAHHVDEAWGKGVANDCRRALRAAIELAEWAKSGDDAGWMPKLATLEVSDEG